MNIIFFKIDLLYVLINNLVHNNVSVEGFMAVAPVRESLWDKQTFKIQ